MTLPSSPNPTAPPRRSAALVVEDDRASALVFSDVLRKSGFDVTVTEDVDEVLRLAREGRLDIVIMDVSLYHSVYQGRRCDGNQIARLLKDNPKTATLPILLVTAHAMAGDRERLLRTSKADEYLAKPVNLHHFVDTVQRLTRRVRLPTSP
jgi:CheY-like chemotaxis protein